jgi:exosortase
MTEDNVTGEQTAVAKRGDSARKSPLGTARPSDVLESNVHGPSSHRLNWSDLGLHNYIKLLIIGALFCYLFRDEFSRITNRWRIDSTWSHGWLIPVFSLYFLNQRKQQILGSQFKKPNYLGLFFLVCCLLCYLFVIYVLRLGYPAMILMIPALGSVALFLGGWRLIKFTWLPIAYLGFAIPLPPWLYREVTIPMRILAAKVAALLLNCIGSMQATASGVVIDIVYKGVRLEPGLDVAEACSGMRLLMAFLALGVAMAYLHYRPAWQRIILLASTVPIAVLCNIIRVTVTGSIYIFIGPQYAQGIYHDFLGLAMLPLAFGIYGLLARFMSSLFIEESIHVSEDIVVRRPDKLKK